MRQNVSARCIAQRHCTPQMPISLGALRSCSPGPLPQPLPLAGRGEAEAAWPMAHILHAIYFPVGTYAHRKVWRQDERLSTDKEWNMDTNRDMYNDPGQ